VVHHHQRALASVAAPAQSPSRILCLPACQQSHPCPLADAVETHSCLLHPVPHNHVHEDPAEAPVPDHQTADAAAGALLRGAAAGNAAGGHGAARAHAAASAAVAAAAHDAAAPVGGSAAAAWVGRRQLQALLVPHSPCQTAPVASSHLQGRFAWGLLGSSNKGCMV
jgi:hypothetical protein